MTPRRLTPDQFAGILRGAASRSPSSSQQAGWRLPSLIACLDLRDPRAFRRSHAAGSVSIPAKQLPDRLFLLPDRSHQVLLAAANGGRAEAAAVFLASRGWEEAAWLDGSPLDLPDSLRRSGREPHRFWRPSPLLATWLDRLPVEGACCDLACGSGRDATALAIGGRCVVGVDLLPDALQRARLLARLSCIPAPGRVRFRRVDLADHNQARALLGKDRFRLLTCFRYLDRALLPLMLEAVDSGGHLVYETFLSRQAEIGRTPRRRSRLLEPGELKAAFRSLEILEYREGPDASGDWLASMVARRPAGDRAEA